MSNAAPAHDSAAAPVLGSARVGPLPAVAGCAAGAVGVLVICGWAWQIEPLKRVVPTFVSMNPATALTFCAAGASLWLQRRPLGGPPRARTFARIAAAVVALVGLAKLADVLLGTNLGVDRWLFVDRLSSDGPVHANRMAPNTALTFVLLGLALLLLDNSSRDRRRPAEYLALAAGAISLVAVIGYLYGVPPLYGVATFIPMALHTAVVFNLLAAGVLFARPHAGWMAIVTSDSPGGMMARRFFPAMLTAFVVIGWLRLAGERLGLYGPELGVTLYTVLAIVVLGLLIGWSADSLHRTDAERRRLERALRLRSEELEATNAGLEAFSYSVSHDLRAPLRHIGGFADLLGKRLSAHAADATSLRFLDTIHQAVRRMNQLINDLLAFARLGRAELTSKPVDLSVLAHEVRKTLAPEQNHRVVEWSIAPLPTVHGDLALLRQVLLNLLSNALKYTRHRDRARIEVGAEAGSRDEHIIFIRDNGAGFDMACVDRLFGVFQRLHSETEFEGTGIGLANVRSIVRRHGGRTWAEGTPDVGATFYFSLPRRGQAMTG